MNLRCLGSGSSGNCYLLSAETETLVLDCGLPIREIKKGLDWDISKVVGVLCTHSHLDHSKSVKDFENMGVPVVTPYKAALGLSNKITYCGGISYNKNFSIMHFDLTDKNGKFMHTNNDGSECPCYGFLLGHGDMGKMLYITDTELVKWRFSGINHILISCNYQKKYISDSAKRTHVLRGHMELGTVKDFIITNKSNALRTVILCHLSQDSADPEECLSEVQKVVGEGVKCVCAAAGETVELSLCPF